jgi:hypothetical protein
MHPRSLYLTYHTRIEILYFVISAEHEKEGLPHFYLQSTLYWFVCPAWGKPIIKTEIETSGLTSDLWLVVDVFMFSVFLKLYIHLNVYAHVL